MPAHEVDVAVVGAGPAGATAARVLAEGGVRTALLEGEALPRYKTCGGGLVGRAVRSLPPDVARVVEREFFRAELRSDGGPLTVSRPAPLIRMAMRDRLDHLLALGAREAGALLLAPFRVEAVTREGQGFRLAAGPEAVRARFLVVADGATGRLALRLGFEDGRLLVPALEAEVRTDPETTRRLGGSARFDLGVVPHGYAWVFPKGEHLSIGVLSMRRGSVGLPATLDRYYGLLGLERLEREERHGYVIPVRPRRGPLARGGAFLVGDAAGLADPVTAEGISHAVASGRLAAEALLWSGSAPGTAEARYRSLLARHILPELRRSRLLARVFYGPVRLRNAVLSRWGQTLGDGLADVFDGDSSYRELLTRRLRRLFSGGAPG